MTLRDPFDGREMPPNRNDYVNAYCIRGVRNVTPASWRAYALAAEPDFVVALSDVPFTPPPFSQKRLTKSIQRSVTWLTSLLQPLGLDISENSDEVNKEKHLPRVLVHMAGDISLPARRAFSAALTETLYGKEADQVQPLQTLDEGVFGYVFDLTPLRHSLVTGKSVEKPLTQPDTELMDTQIPSLMQASLADLPAEKIRVVNSTVSPHEVLALVRAVGVDLFDAHWAQKAADWGVALDFAFPIAREGEVENAPHLREDGKRDIGHNLYDPRYAHSFTRFAACFFDGASAASTPKTSEDARAVCPCAACSPTSPSSHLEYCSIDDKPPVPSAGHFDPPFTRAYVHHLLHTHEMSAHTLLVMHNISVLDAFFKGIRRVLANPTSVADFGPEVERFCAAYDAELRVFEEAKKAWIMVDFERGKGRLAREKARQAEADLNTAVEL